MKPRRNAQYCHTALLLLSIFSILTFVSSPRAEIIDTVWTPSHDPQPCIHRLTDAGIQALGKSHAAGSDWTQFQGNVQHTGYNDRDEITPPLELRWQFYYGYHGDPMNQVTVVGDRAYITPWESYRMMWDDPLVVPIALVGCHNTGDGSQRWVQVYDDVDCMAQATCVDDVLYLQVHRYTGPSGYLDARNALTGEFLWQANHSLQSNEPYAPAVTDGRAHLCALFYGGISTYNAHSGQLLWTARRFGSTRWTPAVHDGVCYTFIYGALEAQDAVTGEALWHTYFDSGYVASETRAVDQRNAPVIDTNTNVIYCTANGALFAVNLTTRLPVWYHVGGRYVVTPALADGVLYAQHEGTLTAYDALTGDSLWCFVGDEYFGADFISGYFPAVVANGHVYVSSTKHVYAVNIHTHEEVWRYPVGGMLSIAGGQLYVANQYGTVYAFGPQPVSVDDPDNPDPNASLPDNFILHQNYPNPFNPTTEISFTLPRTEHVRLDILNPLGQTVTTLLDQRLSPGTHAVTWHAIDPNSHPLATGVYYYRLTAGNHTETRKMLLLK